MTETVEVKASSPVIDVKQNAVTNVVTSEVIDLIPKTGTGILGALSGLPGAGNEGRLGGFGIDGAGASENRYIIDGMDVSSLQNGTLGRDLNITFIDSIQVKSSGYNAEYRAATGGVVSALTKSGTNKFHGDVNAFVSGRPLRGLQGDVRQQIRLVPSDNTKAEYFTTPRLERDDQRQPERTASAGRSCRTRSGSSPASTRVGRKPGSHGHLDDAGRLRGADAVVQREVDERRAASTT